MASLILSFVISIAMISVLTKASGSTVSVLNNQIKMTSSNSGGACPSDPLQYCDFYFLGSKTSVPLISLDGFPDHPASPPVLDSQTDQYIEVDNTDSGYLLAPATSGIGNSTGDEFYISGLTAQLRFRTFNQFPKASYENLCVLLPITNLHLTVNSESINLSPGVGTSLYPLSRRCVVFKTGALATTSKPPASSPTPSPSSVPSPAQLPASAPQAPPNSPPAYDITPTESPSRQFPTPVSYSSSPPSPPPVTSIAPGYTPSPYPPSIPSPPPPQYSAPDIYAPSPVSSPDIYYGSPPLAPVDVLVPPVYFPPPPASSVKAEQSQGSPPPAKSSAGAVFASGILATLSVAVAVILL